LALAEVAAADLDVTIVGQLAAAQLALGDQLKPGPLQVVRVKAFHRRHSAVDEAPEDISRHADHALVLTDADAKLDGLQVRIPPRILGNAECAERRVMSSPWFVEVAGVGFSCPVGYL
jgi:hypothetical protein